MLLLAFSASTRVEDDPVDQEATQVDRVTTKEVVMGLYSPTLESSLERWSWQTELLSQASAAAK